MAKKVLYVEDNPRNMRLVRKFLEHAGYEVLEAGSGLQGLEVAARDRPDVILMDINLPDIDGLEATGRLKEDPELRTIPVIALTANAMHGDKERCLAGGCDGYIPKPINKVELLATVAAFVAAGALSIDEATQPGSSVEFDSPTKPSMPAEREVSSKPANSDLSANT